MIDATHVRGGRNSLLYVAGCNYLALTAHPELLAAHHDSSQFTLLHPGASRATTGDHPLYHQAERALARFVRLPEASHFPCGYMASMAAVLSLRHVASHLLIDAAAHACLKESAVVTGLPVISGRWHEDIARRQILAQLGPRARPAFVTDGLSPVGQGLAPIPALLGDLPKQGFLLIDDAHGLGTLGKNGRGILDHFGIADERILLTTSLAKALGGSGGAVLGTRAAIERVRHTGPYRGTTSPPLVLAAGLLGALKILREEPDRVRQLQSHARRLHLGLLGVRHSVTHAGSPIAAWHPPSPADAARMSRSLRRAGIHPPFIRYLSGPAEGFFRFAVTAAHTEDEIDRLITAIERGVG